VGRNANELVDKAYDLFKQGTPLVEIAKQLGLPEGTVRRWKSVYKWGDSERSEKSERSQFKASTLKKLDESDLTDNQKLFCLYYVKCFNATKAYKKAYGCEEYSARVSGCQLLTNPKIRAEITRLKQERYSRAMLSPDDIFQKFMDIAFSDLTEFVEFGRDVVPVMGPFGPIIDKKTKTPVTKEINSVRFKEDYEVDGSLIAEIKQGRDGASFKLADRMKALEWLADHLDLATEEQKRKYGLERERLEIERKKADQGDGADDVEHGVVILPEILPEEPDGDGDDE
jgi:phage terminase small subunit